MSRSFLLAGIFLTMALIILGKNFLIAGQVLWPNPPMTGVVMSRGTAVLPLIFNVGEAVRPLK